MDRLDDLDILTKFVDFLTNYNLVDAYIENSRGYKCIDIRSDHLIFSAFTWIETPEEVLWVKLDREWRKICKERKEISFQKVIKALKVCAYSDDCLKECPFFNYKADCTKRLTASALEIIKRYQSDVAIVKHGHWVNHKHTEAVICSECKRVFIDETNYCPFCGASMTNSR